MLIGSAKPANPAIATGFVRRLRGLIVIERALQEMDERIFWAEVSAAFERIAANPVENGEVKAEAALWESGAGRDLAGEEW